MLLAALAAALPRAVVPTDHLSHTPIAGTCPQCWALPTKDRAAPRTVWGSPEPPNPRQDPKQSRCMSCLATRPNVLLAVWVSSAGPATLQHGRQRNGAQWGRQVPAGHLFVLCTARSSVGSGRGDGEVLEMELL